MSALAFIALKFYNSTVEYDEFVTNAGGFLWI